MCGVGWWFPFGELLMLWSVKVFEWDGDDEGWWWDIVCARRVEEEAFMEPGEFCPVQSS